MKSVWKTFATGVLVFASGMGMAYADPSNQVLTPQPAGGSGGQSPKPSVRYVPVPQKPVYVVRPKQRYGPISGRDSRGLPGPHHAVNMAIRHYIRTGKADTIYDNGIQRIPFGHSQPTIVCSPLRVCDIELESGEVVYSVALGDTADWKIARSRSGSGAHERPHLLLKPVESGDQTNLIINTSRRTYNIFLKSDKKKYVLRISFWYPDDWVKFYENRQVVEEDSSTKAKGRRESASADRHDSDQPQPNSSGVVPLVDLSKINNDYKISGDHVAWRPTSVFNDGFNTYILLPKDSDSHYRPAFFLLDRGGHASLVPYNVRHRIIVVHQLFDRGVLLFGVGSDRKRVLISRIRKDRGWFEW